MRDSQSTTPGEVIRRLRQLKGFKQSTAAEKLGISQQAYSKIEQRKTVSAKNIAQIIIAFNCSNADIETVKNFTPPPKNKDVE